LFGDAWFRSGWISVSYLKPIYAGDSLEVFGVLVDRVEEGSSVELEFEVWIENQRKENVSVGWIGGTVGV
jgi:acyl-CoA hydrolase